MLVGWLAGRLALGWLPYEAGATGVAGVGLGAPHMEGSPSRFPYFRFPLRCLRLAPQLQLAPVGGLR